MANIISKEEVIARRHLDALRNSESLAHRGDVLGFDPDKCIGKIKDWINLAQLNLSDIGTSEEEFEVLRQKSEVAKREYYILLAHCELWKYRKAETLNHRLDFYLKEAEITLADLVTSEEELNEIACEYSRKKAIELLKEFNTFNNYSSCRKLPSLIERIEYFAAQANLSLIDLGTSRIELDRMAYSIAKESSLKIVGRIRQGRAKYGDYDDLLANIKEFDFLREELGVSKTELSRLGRMYELEYVRSQIKRLRNGISVHKLATLWSSVEYMKQSIQERGFTFLELGTSEAELNAIQEYS